MTLYHSTSFSWIFLIFMPLFCLSQRKTKSILRYDNDLFVKYFTFNIFYWDWHKSCYEYYMIKRNKFTINNLWHIYIISLKLSVDSIPMNDKKLNKGQNKNMLSIQTLCVCAKSFQSCLTLCDPVDCSPPDFLYPLDSPGENASEGCHTLL